MPTFSTPHFLDFVCPIFSPSPFFKGHQSLPAFLKDKGHPHQFKDNFNNNNVIIRPVDDLDDLDDLFLKKNWKIKLWNLKYKLILMGFWIFFKDQQVVNVIYRNVAWHILHTHTKKASYKKNKTRSASVKALAFMCRLCFSPSPQNRTFDTDEWVTTYYRTK